MDGRKEETSPSGKTVHYKGRKKEKKREEFCLSYSGRVGGPLIVQKTLDSLPIAGQTWVGV
jgi:hypothetical protein